jgi:hypothetical protein
MQTYQLAGIAVAAILGLDALAHVYWLTGRTWPARDTRTLSRAVLNADAPFTPRVLVPLIVILTTGAVAVLARAGLLDPWLPGWLPGWPTTVGAMAVAAGAALRAGAGVVWALGIGARRGTVFYALNLAAYTPVCLLLCGAAAVVAARL